jgi:hypothetical protein
MRRSFRVATVFTGAAAITAGFGPVAFAAENATPAGVNGPEVCGANTGGISHWLHLFYPNDDHAAECVRTPASDPIPAKGTITAFCAGSTSGYLYGQNTVNGTSGLYTFTPKNNVREGFVTSGRTTNLNLVSLYALGREGGQKCTS